MAFVAFGGAGGMALLIHVGGVCMAIVMFLIAARFSRCPFLSFSRFLSFCLRCVLIFLIHVSAVCIAFVISLMFARFSRCLFASSVRRSRTRNVVIVSITRGGGGGGC